jgi:hypothetical protein
MVAAVLKQITTIVVMAEISIEKPVFKPDISFTPKLQLFEEKVTIVHCTYIFPAIYEPVVIRIWPTTYLIQDDGNRKKLLQGYNITPFPEWKLVKSGHRFTLIFEGLDKECRVFDLLEDIPEPGAFRFEHIERNKTDVYRLDFK